MQETRLGVIKQSNKADLAANFKLFQREAGMMYAQFSTWKVLCP